MKNACSECEGLFEALSAWLDGQASTAEALRVEAHLEGCSSCREVVEALRALQSAAPAVAVPEVPDGFAARTRRLVEARAGQAWDARLRRAVRRLAEWVDDRLPAAASLARGPVAAPALAAAPRGFREPDPVAALLGTRGLRAGLASPSTWLLLALGLYGGPAVLLALLGRADQAGWFLLATGLGLLVALPAWHLRVDLSVLVSLKRGRCLEEILGTGLPSGSLVDSLAWTSLRNLVRVGLPVALVLLAGTLVLPSSWRVGAALAAAAWLPGVALLLGVASYASQALVLFARGGERPGPATLAVALAMGGPALGLLFASREVAAAACGPEAAASGAGLALAGALGAGALWVGLSGRLAATWGLDHPSELERSNGSARPRRNRWVRAWSENPVVVRESTRASAAIPLGLPGLVLARLLAVTLPVVGTWGLLELSPESRTEAFWAGAAFLGWVAWLRAAARTSAALAQEEEGRTLETLVQSGLAREDFARGWLQVACAPLYLELAVTAAMVLLVALVIPEVLSGRAPGVSGTLDLGAAGLVVVALAAMPVAGAWSGLAVSVSSATRREAGARAVGAWWRALGAWLAAWAVTSAVLLGGVDLAGGELDGTVWSSLVGSVLPAGTLALAVLAQTWSARRAVEGHLAVRWNDPSAELPASPAARRSRRRVLVLGPALAALVLVGLQAGLVLLVFRGPGAPGLTVGAVACGLLGTAGLVALAWRVLSPVLDALADAVGRSPLATGLVAGLFGAFLGLGAAQVPLAVGTLSSLGLLEGSQSPEGWGAFLGFALTGGLAALGALAWPAGEEGWELDPLRRAWEEACRFGRVRALVGLALLLAGLAVLGLQVHRVLTWAPGDPDEARLLANAARAREEAAEAIPAERNGFRLLEPALASRQWERQGVGLARRHRELAEAMKALSWAEVGSRDENLRTLRANPERARQGAARLDAALPAIRQALDRPDFAVPSRLEEGPSAPLPNFLLMRALAQGLRVRALLYEEEGQLDRALELHLLNLRWSDRMAGQGTLIFGMITVALNSIAEEGLLGFLERHRLDEEAYGRVLRVLEAGRVDAEAFLKSLDGEMAFGQAAFEALEAGRIEVLGPEYRVFLLLPRSYWQRDRQLYLRSFLDARNRVARGERGSNLLETNPWWGSNLSLAGALIPNVTRAWFQVRLASSRHAANRLVCLVELHRLRTGRYPATLEELALPGVSRDPLNHRTFDYQRVGNRFRLRTVDAELRRLGGQEERDGVHTWLPGTKS